jgi:hypothetical protein
MQRSKSRSPTNDGSDDDSSKHNAKRARHDKDDLKQTLEFKQLQTDVNYIIVSLTTRRTF